MLSSKDCMLRYGDPKVNEGRHMVLWDVPPELEIGVTPKRLYCNRDLIKPLSKAFKNLIESGCVKELKTWDGCFNIRRKKMGISMSLHSWGLAVDLNASWNRQGRKPTLSQDFVNCFTTAGFDWGGDWRIPDGMHFQLSAFPKGHG